MELKIQQFVKNDKSTKWLSGKLSFASVTAQGTAEQLNLCCHIGFEANRQGGEVMYALVCVWTGVLCGAFVSVFGIWAFLKGQSSAVICQMGGVPEFKTSKRKSEKGTSDISEQIGAMFANAD